MSALGEFLREAAQRRRRVPGEWDCCTFPAAWAIAQGKPDPMAAYRDTYSTEAEGQALIDAACGLHVLFREGFALTGVPEVYDAAEAGDVGVLQLLGEQAGAIYTGERWALVADRGLAFADVNPVRIIAKWRVGNG